MNCFICGNIMENDWHDTAISCAGKDHHFTVYNKKLFHFNFTHNYDEVIDSTLWFELSVINFTLKTFTDKGYLNIIDISDMLYWKTFEELENHCNKLLTFQ